MYKKIVYGLVMICLLLWLLFSTTVILRVSGATLIKEITFREDWAHNVVNYALEDVTERKNFTEDITLLGWAFIETDEDNPTRYTSCILCGENHCYEMRVTPPQDKSTAAFVRNDVRDAFQGKQVPPGPLGIVGDFSTISIKDGYYKIYIYCYENETTYGIADTGIWLKKSGANVYQYDWISERHSGISPTESALCRSNFDSMEMKGDNLKIRGWAFSENMSSSSQKIFVEFMSETDSPAIFNCMSETRQDVGKAYENALYNESGFSANIPMKELPDGTYTLRVLVENDGKVWASQAVDLSKSGDTLEFQK